MDFFDLLDREDVNGFIEYLKIHNANQEINGQTLLYWSTHMGYLGFVKTLVEHGTDINHKDHHDRTALAIACYFGFVDIVKYLLQYEVDLDGCMKWALTSWNGEPQTEIIQLLKEKKE